MRSRLAVTCLTSRTGTHGLHLSVAAGFLSRLRGLMLAPRLDHFAGMILRDCTCIHTCFMRQDIDVLYVDDSGTVVKCVAELPPWRISFGNDGIGSNARTCRARHVIELRAGSISELGIVVGSVVDHAVFKINAAPMCRERGSAMTEFTVVAPILTVLGLAILQYGLLFFAKNQYNHAAFMAARAGSTGNADMGKITRAYETALVPLYGGGTNTGELAASFQKAKTDVENNVVINMLNPTTESFSDWNDEDLQQTIGSGMHRVIPNGGLAMKKAAIVPAASSQSIHDANLLKLRITHGYKPQVPVIGLMINPYLRWLDAGAHPADSQMIQRGLIPVVMHVSMHMQSDAIEGASMSAPGPGNGGTPSNPGPAPGPAGPPPTCATVLCTTAPASPGAGGGGQAGGGSTGNGEAGNGSAGGGQVPSEPGQGNVGGRGAPPGSICVKPAGKAKTVQGAAKP